jgi:hypothetical protein
MQRAGAPRRRRFQYPGGLVEHAGEMVSKEKLIARAWPQRFARKHRASLQNKVAIPRKAHKKNTLDAANFSKYSLSIYEQIRKTVLVFPSRSTYVALIDRRSVDLVPHRIIL